MLEKVAFYVEHSWQKVFLEPLKNFCHRDLDCLCSGEVTEVVDFKPQVVFHVQKLPLVLRKDLPEAFMIGIGAQSVPQGSLGSLLKRPDIVCLPRKSGIRHAGLLDCWQTGLPVMDSIFQGLSRRRDRDARKVLLYTPCGDENRSAHPVLGTAIFDKFMKSFPNLRIWIKPHPEVEERRFEWLDAWWEAARGNPNLSVIDAGTSLFEVMPQTDMMISDFNDLYTYYLALDRPVILVDNPGRFNSPACARGEQCKDRNAVLKVGDGEELLLAVQKGLQQPHLFSRERREAAGRLFPGKLDGKASERIMRRVFRLTADEGTGSGDVSRLLKRKRLIGTAAGFVLWFLPRVVEH